MAHHIAIRYDRRRPPDRWLKSAEEFKKLATNGNVWNQLAEHRLHNAEELYRIRPCPLATHPLTNTNPPFAHSAAALSLALGLFPHDAQRTRRG